MSSAAYLIGAVVAATVLRSVFVAAHRTVGWAVACTVVAVLIEPVVEFLDTRLPRGLAIAVTIIGVVAVVGAFAARVYTEITGSLDSLQNAAPLAAQRLEARYSIAREFKLLARVQDVIDSTNSGFGRQAVTRALGTLPTYMITGILTLFMLGYGRRFARSALMQFDDSVRRQRYAAVLKQTVTNGRNHLLCGIAQGLVVTLVSWIIYQVADIPAAFSLAIITGIISAIPSFGIVIGGVPAVLIAAGFVSTPRALIVLALLVTLQCFEAFAVRPFVDRRTVHVGPLIPIIVALLGFELYGPGGAVYGGALAVFAMAWVDAVSDVASIDLPPPLD